MAALQSWATDRLTYASGYLAGRSHTFPTSFSSLYASLGANIGKAISLPLPFLSFLALPFFGGTSTTITLAFFYLTWSTLVLSHTPLTIEIYGTFYIRLIFFLLPALASLAFDTAVPSLSRNIKNRGTRQSPLRLGRRKLLHITGYSLLNLALTLALHATLEFTFTRLLHLRSIIKVSTTVPFPWTILKDVAKGYLLRGILLYTTHRALHTHDTPLRTWHLNWQHSVPLPFSLIATYDHPVNYVLTQWLPTFLPAYLFRFHVLTWHLFIALCSLEDLFVYSGYAVLPSSIIMVGMARRNDEHFATIYDGQQAGNFGRTGILDFVCGTTCKGEDDAMDDLQAEAEKHQIQERAGDAIDGAVSGLKGRKLKGNTRATRKKS